MIYLLEKNKMTIPLSEAYFDDNIRYFSKNSKLSDFIINQKKSSPDILKANSNDDFLIRRMFESYLYIFTFLSNPAEANKGPKEG